MGGMMDAIKEESAKAPTRTVDGVVFAFVRSASYFEGFDTPSMGSIQRATGAGIVLLLAEGKTEADFTDDELRALVTDLLAGCDQPKDKTP